jgi:TetR/AcrR family transcriptional regulator
MKLLRAAGELFARKGYAGTTVREIVAAAGVTKPVLYYYFSSKEGIYLELMGEALRVFEAAVEQALAEGGTASERLLRLLDRIHRLVLENLEVVRVVHSIYYGPPQGAPFFDFEAFHLRLSGALQALVAEGMRRGEFGPGDVEDTAWVFLGAVEVAEGIALSHPEMQFDASRLSRLLQVILRGVLAGGTRGMELSQ